MSFYLDTWLPFSFVFYVQPPTKGLLLKINYKEKRVQALSNGLPGFDIKFSFNKSLVPGIPSFLIHVVSHSTFIILPLVHAIHEDIVGQWRTVVGHKSPVGSDFPPKLNFFAAYLNKTY